MILALIDRSRNETRSEAPAKVPRPNFMLQPRIDDTAAALDLGVPRPNALQRRYDYRHIIRCASSKHHVHKLGRDLFWGISLVHMTLNLLVAEEISQPITTEQDFVSGCDTNLAGGRPHLN